MASRTNAFDVKSTSTNFSLLRDHFEAQKTIDKLRRDNERLQQQLGRGVTTISESNDNNFDRLTSFCAEISEELDSLFESSGETSSPPGRCVISSPSFLFTILSSTFPC